MSLLINWAEIGQTLERVSEVRKRWTEEDVKRPLVCRECDGEGVHEREDFRAPYSIAAENLSEDMQLDAWHVACTECKGTGEMLCEFCGEPAEYVSPDGIGSCAKCEQEMLEEERRTA